MATGVSYGPIGFCIYCGATACDLSREHIVPLSLGGNHVLLKASCRDCADITKQFEMFCARTIWGPFRVRTGAPTRRPKQRPSKLPLRLIDKDGAPFDIEVPAGEHPATLLLPVLDKPRALMVPGEKRRETFKMWLAIPDREVLNLATDNDASAMRLGSFEILNFIRLLAKIAHAAAFMDGKWPSPFEPLLPDLILGKSQEYDHLVGGIDRVENDPEDAAFPFFFESVDVDDWRYLVGQLRLFANQRSPIYRIVVGRTQIT